MPQIDQTFLVIPSNASNLILVAMRGLYVALTASLLAACAVGPDYVRPSIETPAAYKGDANWKSAEPRDDAPRGNWWEVFGDAELNSLEGQVQIGNQNVAQAEARFRAASALVQSARASYFPVVSADASATRSGGGRGGGGGGVSGGASSRSATNHSVAIDLSWEIDLWGRVRRLVESQSANVQASVADLAGVRLSAQAALAADYFQLRQVDAQKQLLDDTIAAYMKTFEVTRSRYAGGVSARVDVAQAETQVKTTQVQAIDLGIARAQLEHAIALLLGKPASSFSIVARKYVIAGVPAIPAAGLPSQLLERRPDVAAAERRVASANAQIGVAKAAYFPALSLSASGGFSSIELAGLLTAPNRFWSIGPTLLQSVFDGGLRRAQTDQAIANYDANVAAYRQTVLAGFSEVEDFLASLRVLEAEADAQDDALRSARESLALTFNQYKAGTVSYLNVVTAQATALSSERNAVNIFGNRMSASVQLIRALGGGWDAALLPP